MRPGAVVIGGSRGLGSEIAARLATTGHDLVVSARPSPELTEVVRKLRAQFGVEVAEIAVDLTQLDVDGAEAYVAKCRALLPALSQVYITAGTMSTEDVGADSIHVLAGLMAGNCVGVCQMVGAFARRLQHDSSNITTVSSVAAVRPRSRNVAYAASKGALEMYIGGLRHHYAGGPMRLQVCRAGYMRSRLSEGQRLLLPPADPRKVAFLICAWRGQDYGMRYVPRYWTLVTMVVRLLPWWLFRRLRF